MKPRLNISRQLRAIHQLPAVNRGGCAYVALALHAHVAKHYPHLVPQILYLMDDDDLYDYRNGEVTTCHHAVIRIGSRYYDSEGGKTLSDMLRAGGCTTSAIPVSPEFVQQSLQLEHYWNPEFDRSNVHRIYSALERK